MSIYSLEKLDAIIKNWRDGNRATAAKAIKALPKLALAELLINHHRLPNGFIGLPNMRVEFEDFVLQTLLWS